MDKAKIICAFLLITFVICWVIGGIFLAVYVTKDDRLETGIIFNVLLINITLDFQLKNME